MTEHFDFDWHEAQLAGLDPDTDLPADIGCPMPRSEREVPERCWQCDFLHERLPWPGYEQHVLGDSGEWHVLPGRYDFGEPCEVQHYCGLLQCWRDPDSDACERVA